LPVDLLDAVGVQVRSGVVLGESVATSSTRLETPTFSNTVLT
jgi:hypothetical protein